MQGLVESARGLFLGGLQAQTRRAQGLDLGLARCLDAPSFLQMKSWLDAFLDGERGIARPRGERSRLASLEPAKPAQTRLFKALEGCGRFWSLQTDSCLGVKVLGGPWKAPFKDPSSKFRWKVCAGRVAKGLGGPGAFEAPGGTRSKA